jgi:hypothetical protein
MSGFGFILEKAVEPQKSAKGSKYQPFTALGDITQQVDVPASPTLGV